jgi:hypothetical protein
MMPFLITGLPRSRTAWFAALCDAVPEATCSHEPCARTSSWRAAVAAWRRPAPSYIGISDPTLSLHLGVVLAEFWPRVLWVDRPIGDVEESLRAIGIENAKICRIMLRKASPFLGHVQVRRVAFADLVHDHVVADCLRHLMPGHAPDLAKIQHFQRLNIQVKPEATAAELVDMSRIGAIIGDDVLAELCAR